MTWRAMESVAKRLIFLRMRAYPITDAGLRGFVSGAHVIFYRAARADEHGDIVIVRILGKSMDHERHLK